MELKLRRFHMTGAPIALQIMALLLAAVVVANGLSFLVVVLVPPPRPAIWRVADVAAALKGGPLQTREGKSLSRRIEPHPPRAPDATWQSGPQHLLLAQDLAMPPEKVSLVESHPLQRFGPEWLGGLTGFGPGEFHRHGRGRLDDPLRGPPGDGLGRRGPGFAGAPGGGPRDGDHGPGPGPFMFGDPGGFRAFDRMPLIGDFTAGAQMPDGRWLVVSSPREPFPNAWQFRVLLRLAACLVVIGAAGFLFSRRITAPISAFADAAERLGRDPRQGAIPLSGSAEIGKAAAAFNRMQERLKRYVDDRTAMVAAISHDLRTPLARIRFKVEDAPEEIKVAVIRDIERMENMIGAVLAFIRDASEPSHRERLDLRSLVEVVADDAAAMGDEVPVNGEDRPIIVDGDPTALTRLFGNLVDNALKYGKSAEAVVFQADDHAVVQILDSGPGLPGRELERVFDPFYRSDPARTLTTDGVGLGLAVSRSIARAHGGDIVLVSNLPTGLIARVTLPLAARPSTSRTSP